MKRNDGLTRYMEKRMKLSPTFKEEVDKLERRRKEDAEIWMNQKVRAADGIEGVITNIGYNQQDRLKCFIDGKGWYLANRLEFVITW